jgi:hypothetical protein
MMADETMADVQRPKTFEEYVAAEQASDPKTGKKGMWLLLGCIDYRYPRRTVDAMHRIGPNIPYDQFILAGASLGACVPAWQAVLVQHVQAALKLQHQIEQIIILDHRDCGAYQHPREIGVPETILKEGLPRDVLPSVEKACHEGVLSKLVPVLKDLLRREIPNLKISAWLLTRDQDDPLDVEPA